jgi:hypothetical protein
MKLVVVSLLFEENSLFRRNSSLFAFQDSLFHRVGNSDKNPREDKAFSATTRHQGGSESLKRGEPLSLVFADFYKGEALMIGSHWKEGAGYLRKAIAEAVGLYGMGLWQKLEEVELLASRGRIDDALALVDEAIANAEEHEHLRSPALRQRADLLAQSNADASTIDAATAPRSSARAGRMPSTMSCKRRHALRDGSNRRCLQRFKTEPLYRRKIEPPWAGSILRLFLRL